MLKQEISFVDFRGNKKTKTYYFNMTRTNLAEMEMDNGGVLRARLEMIMENRDAYGMAKFFRQMIVNSYGVPSEDGESFDHGKNHSLGEEFTKTAAFDVFFRELLSDPEGKKAEAFIYGIIPKDVADEARANTVPNITVDDGLQVIDTQ